jgi:aconitase B
MIFGYVLLISDVENSLARLLVTKKNPRKKTLSYPYEGKACRHGESEPLTTFSLKTQVLLDEVQAGGRIPLIIGEREMFSRYY